MAEEAYSFSIPKPHEYNDIGCYSLKGSPF